MVDATGPTTDEVVAQGCVIGGEAVVVTIVVGMTEAKGVKDLMGDDPLGRVEQILG